MSNLFYNLCVVELFKRMNSSYFYFTVETFGGLSIDDSSTSTRFTLKADSSFTLHNVPNEVIIEFKSKSGNYDTTKRVKTPKQLQKALREIFGE